MLSSPVDSTTVTVLLTGLPPEHQSTLTPVLKSLHWLPVSYRIDFKVLLLVYKSLNG